MGYAGQLEADSAPAPGPPGQAAIIRRQSQTIRDLVNDLNLTMRLDCQMQALRKTKLDLAPSCAKPPRIFSTAVWRRFLPGAGPAGPALPSLEADEFLLRRALNNLLINCVRHNPRGLSSAWGPGRQARHACSGWKTPPPMPLPHHWTRRRTVAQPTEPG
ncbi:MAG: hypothetical protein ACLS82_06360 [Evtepia gabavorous]